MSECLSVGVSVVSECWCVGVSECQSVGVSARGGGQSGTPLNSHRDNKKGQTTGQQQETTAMGRVIISAEPH